MSYSLKTVLVIGDLIRNVDIGCNVCTNKKPRLQTQTDVYFIDFNDNSFLWIQLNSKTAVECLRGEFKINRELQQMEFENENQDKIIYKDEQDNEIFTSDFSHLKLAFLWESLFWIYTNNAMGV